MPELNQELITRAAKAIRNADALLISAGAGMGVDSGMPDFRGNDGFWKAYPPFAKLGLSFKELATPEWFFKDPTLAWGFYGHRLNLYRATTPHAGFSVLRRWCETKPYGVYTSNVDGHFHRSGFENVCEVHGSILHLQCILPCTTDIWEVGDLEIHINEETFRAEGELPKCPHCGALARPNILMFRDGSWLEQRSLPQEVALGNWLRGLDLTRLTIIEMGAGGAIPTVRYFDEIWQKKGSTLIRINPREPLGRPGTISIEAGAKATLEAIDAILSC